MTTIAAEGCGGSARHGVPPRDGHRLGRSWRERLAGGNDALALLGNTLPTGAILIVLITVLGPISGAHFNPAVTLAFALRGELARARGRRLHSVRRSRAASPGVRRRT